VEEQDTQDGRCQTGSVHALIQSGIVVNEISNKYGRGGILISSNASSEKNDKSKVLLSFMLFKNQLQYATRRG
jgi:hypothetical protein